MIADCRDDLAANVAALVKRWKAMSPQLMPAPSETAAAFERGLRSCADELTALLGGDTSALDRKLAEERERIAAAIQAERHRESNAGFPPAWFSAMDRAARIARAGGTP